MHFRKWLESEYQKMFSFATEEDSPLDLSRYKNKENYTKAKSKGGVQDIWMQKYPRVRGSSDLVDGRRVLNQVDNMSSIAASLTNYRILPGIRRIKTSEFESWATPYTNSYSVQRTNHVRNLAAQIQKTNRIMPFIVVIDKDGPYVLEGSHRYDALHLLNAKEIPAIIVIDMGEQ